MWTGFTDMQRRCFARTNSTTLQAPVEAVLPSLHSTERRLAKDPQRTEVYCQEIEKLEKLAK